MASTLKQVAREAGVAISTVSRALNEHPNVDPATRRRVLEAAARLGYRPNNVARALRSRATRTVGVVVPDMLNDYYGSCTAVLQEHFEQRGYGMILATSGNDVAREGQALARLCSAQVEGIVLVPTARRWQLPDDRIPVVEMNRRSLHPGVDCVQSAEAEGAQALVQHLLAHGHRRIGVICGEPRLSTTIERLEGIRAALREADLPDMPDLVISGGYSRAFGAEAFRKLLRGSGPPTALFATSSELALGALGAAQDEGVSIPDQMSMVAFGNPAWYRVTSPALTCFELPLREVGLITAQLLMQRLGSPGAEPAAVRVQGRAILRDSVRRV